MCKILISNLLSDKQKLKIKASVKDFDVYPSEAASPTSSIKKKEKVISITRKLTAVLLLRVVFLSGVVTVVGDWRGSTDHGIHLDDGNL